MLKNIFSSLPSNLEQEVFETILGNDNILVERIVSKGHSSPESGWHDQDKNEWVIVLQGEAVIEFENGESERLTVGSHIIIPSYTRHKVIWTAPDIETIWIAVHYP